MQTQKVPLIEDFALAPEEETRDFKHQMIPNAPFFLPLSNI